MEKYLTSSHAEFQGPPSHLTAMDAKTKTKKSPLRLGLSLAPPARLSALRSRKTVPVANNDSIRIKTFAYESTDAGKPPVVGNAPVKGNGPVRLQTSRRLSSGELLITHQANDRTLSDIKNGEYTVGRKVLNRLSSATNKKEPIPLQKPAPRPLSPPREASSLPPTPRHFEELGFDKSLSLDSLRGRSLGRDRNMTDPNHQTHPSFTPPLRPSSRRDSGSRSNADTNVLVHALYKAENSRLAAIYAEEDGAAGYEGTSPNHSMQDMSHQSATGLGISNQEMPYVEGHPIATENPQLHGLHVTPESYTTETSSLYSSTEQSLMSSARSNSDSTNRTSVQNDHPTSRDEVRRMIDDMRTMYLSAIESRSRTSSPRASPRISQDTFSQSPVVPQTSIKQVRYSSESPRQSSTNLSTRKSAEVKKGRKRKSSASTKAPSTVSSGQASVAERASRAQRRTSGQSSAAPGPTSSPECLESSHLSQTTSGIMPTGLGTSRPNGETSSLKPSVPRQSPRGSRKVSQTRAKVSRQNSLKRADSLTLGSMLGPRGSRRETPTPVKVSHHNSGRSADGSRTNNTRLFARPEPLPSPDMPEFI